MHLYAQWSTEWHFSLTSITHPLCAGKHVRMSHSKCISTHQVSFFHQDLRIFLPVCPLVLTVLSHCRNAKYPRTPPPIPAEQPVVKARDLKQLWLFPCHTLWKGACGGTIYATTLCSPSSMWLHITSNVFRLIFFFFFFVRWSRAGHLGVTPHDFKGPWQYV